MIGPDRRIGGKWNTRDKAEQARRLTGLRYLTTKALGRRLVLELIFLWVRRIRLEHGLDVMHLGPRDDSEQGKQQTEPRPAAPPFEAFTAAKIHRVVPLK